MLFAQSFLAAGIKINKQVRPALDSQVLKTKVTEVWNEMQLGSGLPKSTG